MTGTERKRAWRLRQRQQSQQSEEGHPRIDFVQEVASIVKILRAEVRLKHSLAADAELGRLIPAARKFCAGLMHRGHVPDLETVKRLLTGGKYPTR
jgi:hypothetical protein